MPLNPYAELDTAVLSDAHNGLVGLLAIAEEHRDCLPPDDWGVMVDNMVWVQEKIDLELERRELLALPDPEQAR